MSQPSSPSSPSQVPTREHDCYHCGLPIPDDVDLAVDIEGTPHHMCCTGCQAVAQSIVSSGLIDYYRRRDAMPEQAREAMPESAPVVAALAQAQILARRPLDAAKLAREARARHAGDLGLIRVEALATIKAGRAAQAVADAENAIAGRRTSFAGALALADVYQEAKRFGDAIAVLSPLASAHPDDVTLAFRLSSAYDAANRPAEAEKLLRGIIASDPTHSGALNYLGYMLANRGQQLPDALALVDRALAGEPGNPAYLDSRGWALFKMGRAADAEAPLRQAATSLRGNSVIQSHFAEVLSTLGKRDEAAERLELALKGDLADVDPAALEKRLQQLRRRAR